MRDGPRGFPQNFSCSAVLRCRLAATPGFRLRDCHPLRSRFPSCSAILVSSAPSPVLQPRAMRRHIPGLGSCAFARHYLRNHSYFLFLRVLRCFSSPRSPRRFSAGVGIAPHGFPHSDICGSICICHSPQLFAAYHVLRRLREPQASPMRPCSLSLFLPPSVKPLLQLLDSRFVKSLESVLRILLFASRFHHVNDLFYLLVVPGRLELPTSTLSV